MPKRIKQWFSIIVATSLMAACNPVQSQHSVYRSAFEGDIPSLDPIQVGDTQSHDVAHNIYNALVGYRPVLEKPGEKLTDLVPELAESWDISEDGKIYTFHLRKGVQFHHGREFVAHDVKYTIERLANPKNASKGLWTLNALPIEGLAAYQKACEAGEKSELTGIRVVDNHTVEIRLSQMVPFALHVLAMAYYYIVPREMVEKWGDKFTEHPVGTGPYAFKEWKRNQKVVLVKNNHFYRTNYPKIEELRFYIVPDENVRFLWFENGELEHLNPLPSSSFGRILADPKWNPMGARAIRRVEQVNDAKKSHLIKEPLLVIQYLGLDNQSDIFKDKRVRQAFNYGVNKQKLIDVVLNGRGIPARGVLPYGFPAFDPNRPLAYPYDLEKAKQLLDAAGWKDTNGNGIRDKNGKELEVTFWHNQSAIYAQLGAAVQADLRDIGAAIDVRSMEWAPYIEKIRRNEAIFFRLGWQADYPDPDNYLWTLLSTDNLGQDNSSRYSNPEVDKLLNQARSMTNWKEREKLYRQAETLIIEDAPWIFLYSSVEYKLVQPYVKGQQLHPLIQNEMTVVSLER